MENRNEYATVLEGAIIEALPENMKFISRDEEGELWVTKDSPSVVKGDDEVEFLAFKETRGLDGMYSLSVFDHLFDFLGNLSIIELDKTGE